ncbi:MAG: hypothetical protein BWX98_00594 [Candidatus Aminicenantes bacterium ADurb.Bin147]|nr:MAG: hypothetical protein BWX98_00594 [Candidatus Aminicenantes bacterium ADurb.Bin147]
MGGAFHPARPGSLQRPAGVVEPDIAAGDHRPGDFNVIVFQENQGPGQRRMLAEVDDLLDEALALLVAGMSFAGKNELDRMQSVFGHPDDRVQVVKQEGHALVGGGPAAETDRQGFRVESQVGGKVFSRSKPAVLNVETVPAEFNQVAPQDGPEGPQLLVGHEGGVFGFRPERWGVGLLRPIVSAPALPEPPCFRRHPGQEMDAVGDVADGDVLLRPVGPQGPPHGPADSAVKLADAVGRPGGF